MQWVPQAESRGQSHVGLAASKTARLPPARDSEALQTMKGQEGQNTALVTGQRQAPRWLCLVSGSGSRVGLSRLLGQDSGCGSGHHLPLEPAGFPSLVPSLPTAK